MNDQLVKVCGKETLIVAEWLGGCFGGISYTLIEEGYATDASKMISYSSRVFVH